MGLGNWAPQDAECSGIPSCSRVPCTSSALSRPARPPPRPAGSLLQHRETNHNLPPLCHAPEFISKPPGKPLDPSVQKWWPMGQGKSTCQGIFCAAQARMRMAVHTWSLCRLALLCTLILRSTAPTLQIFISVVTQCLLNRSITLNRPPPRCALEDIPFLC